MKQNGTMQNGIDMLEPFVLGLEEYLKKGKTLSLFKKLPLRDENPEMIKRLSTGSYLFSPCGIELNNNECNLLTLELIELLKKHLTDPNNNISEIADIFLNEQITVNKILTQTLKNEGNEIRKQIRQLNLREDLFTFFLIYLVRPVREQAALHLTEGIEKLDWNYGYCPICGHWPSLGHINAESGTRTLWCLCCNTKWNFKRTQCAFCLNEDHKLLENINPENEEHYFVQACKSCKRYLKQVRTNADLNSFQFDKIYLGTLSLDLIAEHEGYIQESVLTVRYDNTNNNELLMYRQKNSKEQVIN